MFYTMHKCGGKSLESSTSYDFFNELLCINLEGFFGPWIFFCTKNVFMYVKYRKIYQHLFKLGSFHHFDPWRIEPYLEATLNRGFR